MEQIEPDSSAITAGVEQLNLDFGWYLATQRLAGSILNMDAVWNTPANEVLAWLYVQSKESAYLYRKNKAK